MARISEELEVTDGVIRGPLRKSVNNAQQSKGSIHDDATATKLGFRGGTVAGSIHMELFPPLLVKAFGPEWFERGTLSLYFVNATTDREAVRAFVDEPPAGGADAQVKVRVEREDGMPVAEGTASLGRPEKTALEQKDLTRFEPGKLRILEDVRLGDPLGPVDVSFSRDQQQARRDIITEPLDCYYGDSPWGGPVATPMALVHLLYGAPVRSLKSKGNAVGLFGAIEVSHVNGPVLLDKTYTASGSVVAVGQSPKTEYVWFDTGLDDEDGRRIAGMRMMLRWMKASSPLYAE